MAVDTSKAAELLGHSPGEHSINGPGDCKECDRLVRVAAEIARLTRERDEARGEARKWDDAHDEACKALRRAEAERDSWRRTCERLESERKQAEAERDRLRGRMRWVERAASARAPHATIQEQAAAALRGEEGE